MDTNKITRLEIINHNTKKKPIGRMLVLKQIQEDFSNIELSIQDEGRTLKIFLNE